MAINKFSFAKAGSFALALVSTLALNLSMAHADSGTTSPPLSPFATPPDSDRAFAWIDFLFKGTPLTDNLASFGRSLTSLAEGLRHALGIYNYGMLTVGALLLFYTIISMVVDTAHSGVVMGRKTNKIWAPIRLVIAIGLLMPISGGLSSGQYLVIKIAKTGSELASNAWQTIAGYMGDNLSLTVTPRPPNATALVTNAIEMEACRAIYQQVFAQALANQAASDASSDALQITGPINDITKWPADQLMPETWRYSNLFNTNLPLCGEYQFDGYRPYDLGKTSANPSEIERAASSFFAFAHLEAAEIMAAGNSMATRLRPTSFSNNTLPNVDLRNDIDGFVTNIQVELNEKLKTVGLTNATLASDIIGQSVDAGWVAAADIIPEFIRLQQSYGEIVSHSLPSSTEPLFDHPALAHQVIFEALPTHVPLATPQAENYRELTIVFLYAQVGHQMALLHNWLQSTQMPKNALPPASSLDFRDHISISTEPSTIFGMFAAAFDARALAEGVWGTPTDGSDAGNPFSASLAAVNPFAALAEFGRRQYKLATYMLGLCGSTLNLPGALAPAVLFMLAAGSLFVGGLGLIFVVPFLPVFRFFIAILVWALNLFEAVAAMPIVALAHLTPTGEGLSGGTARQAYRLWLSLMIRPILTLAGFILGFLFFTAAMSFFSIAMEGFAHLASTSNSGLLLGANLALILMFDLFAYIASNAAFRGISWLPDQALRWVSSFTVTESNEAEPQAASLANLIPLREAASSMVTNLIAPSIASQTSSVTSVSNTTAANVGTGMGGGYHKTEPASVLNPEKSSMFPSYHGQGGGKIDVPPLTVSTPNVTINLKERDTKGPQGIKAPVLPAIEGKAKPVDLKEKKEDVRKKPAEDEPQNTDAKKEKEPDPSSDHPQKN